MLALRMVPFRPTPRLLNRRTAMPRDERCSAICKKGREGSSDPVTSGGRYSFMSIVPLPWRRRNPGKGPVPDFGRVSWASVWRPSSSSRVRSRATYSWAQAHGIDTKKNRTKIKRREANAILGFFWKLGRLLLQEIIFLRLSSRALSFRIQLIPGNMLQRRIKYYH